MSKDKTATINLVLLMLLLSSMSFSQDFYDTSNTVIRKVSVSAPSEYNISDMQIEFDTTKLIYTIFMSLEIPDDTKLSLNVTDSLGDVIMILADNIHLKSGTFRIRWNMSEVPLGRYWCEFITEKFIYRKDFFLAQ